jgi:ribosomal protein L24
VLLLLLLLLLLLQHPIHYSNVMLLDPEKNTPVRVAFAYEDQPPYRRVSLLFGLACT